MRSTVIQLLNDGRWQIFGIAGCMNVQRISTNKYVEASISMTTCKGSASQLREQPVHLTVPFFCCKRSWLFQLKVHAFGDVEADVATFSEEVILLFFILIFKEPRWLRNKIDDQIPFVVNQIGNVVGWTRRMYTKIFHCLPGLNIGHPSNSAFRSFIPKNHLTFFTIGGISLQTASLLQLLQLTTYSYIQRRESLSLTSGDSIV